MFLYRVGNSSEISSIYLSELTADSKSYFNDCDEPTYYEQIIGVQILTEGYYTFLMNGTMGMTSSLYKGAFHPMETSRNRLLQYFIHCGLNQFKLTIYLQGNMEYVLIMRKDRLSTTELFSILINGPNNIIFTPTSKYSIILFFNQR